MKTLFVLSLLAFSSSAFASVCVIAPPYASQSTDGQYIVEICDGTSVPQDTALGPWPDYLIQASAIMNSLSAQGYKVVSQSGEQGATTWTLQK